MNMENFFRRQCRAYGHHAVAFFLALFVCSASSLVASSPHMGCCSTGCKSRGITQEIIDKHHGKLVLSKPGSYHLEHDVKGTIYIKSSNICLDLCCHTVNAKCHPNAIVVGKSVSESAYALPSTAETLQMVYTKEDAIRDFFQKEITETKSSAAPARTLTLRGVKNRANKSFALPGADTLHHIRISNGSVVGATEDAIVVNAVFDIVVSNLTMAKNATNSINVLNSNAVAIHDIAFFGGGASPLGERALRMSATDNFDVKNLAITGYTCTLGSLIELDDCHTGAVVSADVSLNTCKPSQVVYFESLGSFVTLLACTEVDLKQVHVNRNVYEDLGITFCGIYLVESQNCSILDCEVCNNVDQSTAEDASFDGLFILFSDNCNVNGYKFNENKTINYRFFEFCGIVYCNSANAVCENVEINRNVAEDISWFQMHGIWTVNFFEGSGTRDITMRNCEIMDNVTNGSSDGVTSYIAIRVNSSDNQLENCRMNNNKGYTEAAQFIQGFACSGGANSVRIRNCQANLNDAPDVVEYSAFPGPTAACVGFNFHSGTVELSNSSAAYNGNAGVLTYGNIVVQCDNCVFDRNGTVTQKVIGAGLAIGVPAFGSSGNIIVRNSLFARNGSSSLTQEGYGIYVNPGRGNEVLIENTDIFETSGAAVAAGIFSDGTSDVVIKNVTVRETFGVPEVTDCAGIHLANINDVVVKDAVIVATQGVGVKFENVSVFEIAGTSSSSNQNEGYMLVDSSNGIVQESKALSNGGDGFFDDQTDLAKINTYINNVASKNNANFNVGVNTLINNISVN